MNDVLAVIDLFMVNRKVIKVMKKLTVPMPQNLFRMPEFHAGKNYVVPSAQEANDNFNSKRLEVLPRCAVNV